MTQAEIRASDDRGYTALHWIVCNRAATEGAIDAMIQVCPEGLMQVNEAGWTPLHVACWRGALPHVIEYLLRREPQAAWILDNRLRLPLHCACLYADVVPIGTIRYLLTSMLRDGTRNGVEMSVLRKDKCGDTPLTLLMYAYREVIEEMRKGGHLQQNGNSDSLREKLDHYFTKMSYLIAAANRGTVFDSDDPPKPLLLRQAIVVNEVSSPEFIELLLSKANQSELTSCAKQKGLADETLPLHMIASKRIPFDKTTMLHSRFSLQNRIKCETMVLKLVLNDFPQAALLRNNEGKTALDLAIESGKKFNEGIRDLILANPSALEARCIDARFYPVILEAMCKDDDGTLDGAFVIIRAQPSLIIGRTMSANDKGLTTSITQTLIKSLKSVFQVGCRFHHTT